MIYKLSTARRQTQVCCFPKGLVIMNQYEKQARAHKQNNKKNICVVSGFV